MLLVLAEVRLLGDDLALAVAARDVVGNVVELASGRFENRADRLVLFYVANVYALLVQASVIV